MENIKHKSTCPIYISQNDGWASSCLPECNCRKVTEHCEGCVCGGLKVGEGYFSLYLYRDVIVFKESNKNDSDDLARFGINNFFKTEAEAQLVADKIKELLKNK